MVHYDLLVDSMRNKPLFKNCQWDTCVTDGAGGCKTLSGCMTLCDSGYHEWKETMNGYKHPTTTAEALWSGRCVSC